MPSAAVAAAVEAVQVFPVQMVVAAAVQAAALDKQEEAEPLAKGLREVVRALMQTHTEVLAVVERVQSAQMETLAQQLVALEVLILAAITLAAAVVAAQMQLHQQAALVAAVQAVVQLQLPEPQELQTRAAEVVVQELQQVQETVRAAQAAAALSECNMQAPRLVRSLAPETPQQNRAALPSIPLLLQAHW